MRHLSPVRARWLLVVVFAIAMAWLESACVFYLRSLVGRLEPYQVNPLPMGGVLDRVELVREAATMVMLLAVGALAGRTWRARLAYTLIAFGVWDICYYLFLRMIYGWPRSPFEWDILFLLPMPWWGPVLAPMCVAGLMIAWGTLVTTRRRADGATEAGRAAWVLNALGVLLALYAFMADSLGVVRQGMDATRTLLPEAFNWSVFSTALVLMAAPVFQILWQIARLQIPRRKLQSTPLITPGA